MAADKSLSDGRGTRVRFLSLTRQSQFPGTAALLADGLQAWLRGARTETAYPKTVVVLDFGSQYSQLITRRVREAGVYSELVYFDRSQSQVETVNRARIVFSDRLDLP